MYKINFTKYAHMVDWDVVYYGITNDLIEANSAIVYANSLIEQRPDLEDSLVISLLIAEDVSKEGILALMRAVTDWEQFNEKVSLRILKYIILDSIKNSHKDISVVLNKLEDVYADFNYPSEMNSFIGYMPIEDDNYNPSNHTQEENKKRLFDNFCTFLEEELKQIKSIFC